MTSEEKPIRVAKKCIVPFASVFGIILSLIVASYFGSNTFGLTLVFWLVVLLMVFLASCKMVEMTIEEGTRMRERHYEKIKKWNGTKMSAEEIIDMFGKVHNDSVTSPSRQSSQPSS